MANSTSPIPSGTPSAAVALAAPAAPAGVLGFLLDLHNRTVLGRVGNFVFATYGLLAAAAYVVGFAIGLWYNAMAGLDTGLLVRFYLFFMVPAVLMGCRAFSILLEWRELFRHPVQTLIKPGYMYHGGVAGGILAMIGFSAWTGVSTMVILDGAAIAATIGESVCRLGCYVYGCCWGRPTSSAFGVRYWSPDSKVVRCAPHLQGVKIHPAQVYALVAHAAQFALFYALLPYKTFDGFFAVAYLITHPLIRISLEYFRQDDRGRLMGGFTHTNLYSLLMIAGGLGILGLGLAGGANTPLDLGVRLTAVATDAALVPWLGLIFFVCFLAYGVHYKKLGSWVAPTTAGMAPTVDEMSAGAAERLQPGE
jgi:prolipoprotein diacylglyceryl transferase